MMNHVTHARNVENFTGMTIVHIKTETAKNADAGDIRPHTAELKDLGGVT